MIKIKLVNMLESLDMTQAELARRTGIRPATINEMFNGTIARINVDHLSKICDVLNCKVEDLLEYVPDKEYYNYMKKLNM